MTREDLAGFEVPVEAASTRATSDFEVHMCDVWCQGIVLPQTLKTLEGFDLRTWGTTRPTTCI